MDLDNAIGGHNFDIPLLGDTEKAIEDLSKPKGIRGCIFCIKIFAVCLFQGKMGNELNLVRTIGRNLEKSRKEQGGCDSTQCCCFFFFFFGFDLFLFAFWVIIYFSLSLSIAHARYIKILTWLWGFRVKIANFSRLYCFAIPRRDLSTKETKPIIEKWPESLGVMIEFYHIGGGFFFYTSG